MTVRSAWELRAMNAAPKPGYYVCSSKCGRYVLAEGPFETHVEAVEAFESVRGAWFEAEPSSELYEWGMMQIRAT